MDIAQWKGRIFGIMQCDICKYADIEFINGIPTGHCMFGYEGTSYNKEGLDFYYRPDKFKCPKEKYNGRN